MNGTISSSGMDPYYLQHIGYDTCLVENSITGAMDLR